MEESSRAPRTLEYLSEIVLVDQGNLVRTLNLSLMSWVVVENEVSPPLSAHTVAK